MILFENDCSHKHFYHLSLRFRHLFVNPIYLQMNLLIEKQNKLFNDNKNSRFQINIWLYFSFNIRKRLTFHIKLDRCLKLIFNLEY